jgi:hypothetical protein
MGYPMGWASLGWIQVKPCRVIIDTGASITIARPYIAAGQEMLAEMNGGPFGRHFGVNKTLDKVKQRYY